MQMRRHYIFAFAIFVVTHAACSMFAKRIYEFPIAGTDRVLAAYRFATGPFSRKFELRLESRKKSALLLSFEGDWYDLACAATAASDDSKRISYLITLGGVPAYVGAYDIAEERPLREEEVDRDALRREIKRLYKGLHRFPKEENVDLIEWAMDSNSCQQAFHARFGYGAD